MIEALGEPRGRDLADVDAIAAREVRVDARHFVTVPNQGSLAELTQNPSETQGGAERIAVGAAVTGEDEALAIS